MHPRKDASRSGLDSRLALAAAVAASMLVASVAAADVGRPWLSIGLLAGSTQPDPSLSDYRWDTAPRAGFGASVMAGARWFAGGLRVWSGESTQRLGAPDPESEARVRATSAELIGHGHLLTLWGTQVLAVPSGGLLHLGYAPDRITIDGGSGPVVADLEPIITWVGGLGLGLRRRLAPQWSAGLDVDHRMYRIGAAHREGDQIETRRETFGDWSARLELAWRTQPW